MSRYFVSEKRHDEEMRLKLAEHFVAENPQCKSVRIRGEWRCELNDGHDGAHEKSFFGKWEDGEGGK